MSDFNKKAPLQPVNAGLFSSPGSSSGLSLGFDEPFNSPFALVAPNSKVQNQGSLTTQSITPSNSLSSSQRSSPAPGGSLDPLPGAQVNASPSRGNDNSTELSTVPLDSPVNVPGESEVPASSASSVIRSVTDSAIVERPKATAGKKYEYGWNDPPPFSSKVNTTPHRPYPSRAQTTPVSTPFTSASAGDIQIQPLVNHPGGPVVSSGSGGPPTGESSSNSNPYRIGTGVGTRKPAFAPSGIASFGSSSSSSSASGSTVGGQPMMVPYQLPPPQDQAGSLQGGHDGAAPPIAGFMPSSSSSMSSTTGSVWNEQGASRQGPVRHHWFYLRSQENYWIPFSLTDSASLENAVMSCPDVSQQVLVPTDGGRYDVDLFSRQRKAVYWEEPVSQVRRCSWFYKGEMDRWYLPYDEATAQLLEESFQTALSQSSWNRKVDLPGGESVIMHSFSSIVHYSHPSAARSMDLEGTSMHPKAVMRGFAELDKVETGEQSRVDHLVFVVHGIGAHHDLSFRRLVDCVDDFREVAQLMLKTHQFTYQAPREGDSGGRVEFLPVHWHSKLHTTGVDDRLRPLTLPSISRLRDFTNSTLLDILYFTSPLFCQTIVSEVALEMNRMYDIFKLRNPSFQGGVSVVGHSLGSVILFDLLCHQDKGHADPSAPSQTSDASSSAQPLEKSGTEGEGVAGEGEEEADGVKTTEEVLAQLNLDNLVETFQKEQIDFDSLLMCSNEDLKELGLGMGPRKKLSSFILQENEQQEAARERRAKAEKLEKEQQAKETVDSSGVMGNLFGVKIIKGLAGTGQTHVEYPQLQFRPDHLFALGSPIGLFLTVRGVEDLGPEFSLPTCGGVFNIFHPFDPVAYRIEPLIQESAPKQAMLMPHHKGRKRFHLELYENLGYVGASIKHHLVEGMRNMWQQLNDLARSHTTGPQSTDQEELSVEPEPSGSSFPDVVDSSVSEDAMPIGILNKGRRIDHVLQEKPIEKLNEYLFALSSHLCYWHSEDTALFLLKEMYQEPNAPLIKH